MRVRDVNAEANGARCAVTFRFGSILPILETRASQGMGTTNSLKTRIFSLFS